MFCPSCGIEDKHANQFCRACGSDLRSVRHALEIPDKITASAATARDEIGRAFAAKIREAQTGVDLKIVAEDVLPEIEKFLESPAEKRMRRIRTGTLISCIGLGAAIAFSVITMVVKDNDLLFIAATGLVTFFIGLSFIINGLLFTVPKKILSDKSFDADSQRELDEISRSDTNELALPPPAANEVFSSVTEHTTHQLQEKRRAKT